MKPKKTRWYWRYLAHEDEAQMIGISFERKANDPNTIIVTRHYLFPEYERPGRPMDIEDARQFWQELQADPDFELIP